MIVVVAAAALVLALRLFATPSSVWVVAVGVIAAMLLVAIRI
jgi:hypothetical protein